MKPFDKKNPFKTPEGYFEKFDERLFEKLSEKRSAIPETEGFKLPEGYFDTLGDKLQQKLNEEGSSKVIPLKSYKKYYYAIAAAAAVLVVALVLNLNKTNEVGFDDLAQADIEYYFDQNELDLSSYEIAEVVPISELEITDMFESSFSEDYVIDYLDENTDYIDELNLVYDE
ncbi:hypothetical protein [Zobellia galactanivorans]|uniref:Conserved hypothetical membrane protein n=1 Tax=Zobellia galactanivorans (strain DSM 12802 / CCUG 47099 / CIP 106680 / NCIMB 13871 / Dsij) TaxID=63186 RepID=G0L070_ZOBGA|nr:hypothetical protein [Zobellia galactanivorans]MBU3027188.1 hypothetical protein [Zobellia galactanivorans]CAZ94161.1 Conserved hypothetical membrane protein [Zobellia galactanivorans]